MTDTTHPNDALRRRLRAATEFLEHPHEDGPAAVLKAVEAVLAVRADGMSGIGASYVGAFLHAVADVLSRGR